MKESKEARNILPFYRNVLQPILEHSVIQLLSGDHKLSPESLIEIRAFSKTIRDIGILLNRLIIRGESVEKIIKENIARSSSTGGEESGR